MRTTKKTQQTTGNAAIIEAVKMLAAEKDIQEELLFGAIEEALKAAYKKNTAREETVPANLSVTLDRKTGDAHVFARKTIVEEVEDEANQITLDEAKVGELFYFLQLSCGISAYVLGVNPFNQPGVEAYKRNMFQLLGKPGYDD